jgi:type VI secretion system protein ImpH
MAPKERKPGSTLRERVFNEYYGFSFFKAVHLLEALSPRKKPLGQTLNPGEEPVRFSVKPGLVFPPSDISGLTRADGEEAPVMEVAFMGLIGPSGVLPYWYNELAIDRAREKDFALSSFLDIFHHRLISLFYLAWKKYRFPENYTPGARDRLSGYLLSLVGLGTSPLADSTGLGRESLIFYSGLLSRQVPSVAAIEATVEFFSGAKSEVEQFIERVIPLDPEDLTRVGAANSDLGVNMVCGSHIKECRTKFRVNVGPMSFRRFVRFLPDSDMLRPIFSLIRYMVGIEYEFEVRLILKKEEVPSCTVGLGREGTPRLGWTTWLKAPGTVHAENPYVTFQESDLTYAV